MRELAPLPPGVPTDLKLRVGSRPDPQAAGDYAKSDNAPRSVRLGTPGTSVRLSIVALPRETVPFDKRYRGFRVLVVNKSGAEISLPALDSALKLVREVQLPNGAWLSIDQTPQAFCGNSRHNVFLPAGRYWELAAPVTSGKQRVTMRLRLLGAETVSNVFDARVDPSTLEFARRNAQQQAQEEQRRKRLEERQSRHSR